MGKIFIKNYIINGISYQNGQKREFERHFTGTKQQLKNFVENLQTNVNCDIESIEEDK